LFYIGVQFWSPHTRSNGSWGCSSIMSSGLHWEVKMGQDDRGLEEIACLEVSWSWLFTKYCSCDQIDMKFGHVQRMPDTRTVRKMFKWKPLTKRS